MESGFLYYHLNHVSWTRTRPEHVWQVDASDRLGPRSAGMIYAEGTRCRRCRVVVFEYPAE